MFNYKWGLLKNLNVIGLLVCCCTAVQGQFYLRGLVTDEGKKPVFHATIRLHSRNLVYYSGSDGTFGIELIKRTDTLTISKDEYETVTLAINAGVFQHIVLPNVFGTVKISQARLVSITKNLTKGEQLNWSIGSETYSALVENDFVEAYRYPRTGFAVNNDKASYSNIRRFLGMGSPVPPDAVRTDEVLNYFDFRYQHPMGDSLFTVSSLLSDCPWNNRSKLLYLQANARKLDPARIPPSNLVFLIDVSGSMDMPNRLPLLKSGFKLLVNNLRPIDTVSIVVYGSTVGVWLPPTSGAEKDSIRRSIEQLIPGGATPGGSGIVSAYRLAKSLFITGGNNRVILATDGDFNVGQSSDEELERLITAHRQSGIYLSCLGVGMGNYKDSKLQLMARKGNGNFAYIDNEAEAEKVLVKEWTQTLYSVADDVYLDMIFDTAVVQSYRLIGYDNKRKAVLDSTSRISGGEVGSGHSLLALFEVRLRDTTYLDRAPYAVPGRLELTYHNPGDTVDRSLVLSSHAPYLSFSQIDRSYQFAATLVLFCSLLKNSRYTGGMNFTDVYTQAQHCIDPSNALQQEFLQLVDQARRIYGRKRKRKE
ncbi:MAG: hypothetical protein RL732_650 [Bacteroidota bacterium]